MELVPRMKTATSTIRPAILLAAIAGLTVTTGMLPASSSAQESTRTIATGSNIPLTSDAPDQYTVKPGDTLWDISKVFLRDPWFWPEIWYVNPQVENPHLIYPGDVLRLVYIEGQPRVTLAERGPEGETVQGGGGKRLQPQVRKEPLSQAITAIPYDVIAGFMGRPTLLDANQVNTAPYVVALRDKHLIGGIGNDFYARGLGNAAEEARYNVIHVEEPIRDPETRKILGYTGIYVGTGPVLGVGDPAKLTLTDSSREILQGDKLFPEVTEVNVDFVPHAPTGDVDALVIAVKSHTVLGQYDVVALNRGSASGLEPGHVLAVHQRGDQVRDRYSKGGLGVGSGSMSKYGKPV